MKANAASVSLEFLIKDELDVRTEEMTAENANVKAYKEKLGSMQQNYAASQKSFEESSTCFPLWSPNGFLSIARDPHS